MSYRGGIESFSPSLLTAALSNFLFFQNLTGRGEGEIGLHELQPIILMVLYYDIRWVSQNRFVIQL